MLANEYQKYITAMHTIAGAQIQAGGKFKSRAVLKSGPVAKAAAGSFQFTLDNAAHKQKETAKFMNAEIAKMTFSAVKKLHKQLKKQGLVMLAPAAAVGTTVAANAPKTQSVLGRRAFISGVSALALLGGVGLTATPAQAGDTAYWGAVKKQVRAFLKAQSGAMAKSITG